MTARKTTITLPFSATILLSLLLGASANAIQEPWKTIAPDGEVFSAQMPTFAFEGSRLVKLGEGDSIPARIYFSLLGNKRFSVASFRRTNTEQSPHLTTFEKFLNALEQSFSGETSRVISLASQKIIDGREWRHYELNVDGAPGVARFIETERIFYAAVVTGASDEDADVNRFFSSFRFASVNSQINESGVIVNPSDYLPAPTSSTKRDTSDAPELWSRRVAPLHGGYLNGKAVSLPKPSYPIEAGVRGISGTVEVQILVDENGRVIFASAVKGPVELRQATADAARKARFSPTRLKGQPTKVQGRLIYNFIR